MGKKTLLNTDAVIALPDGTKEAAERVQADSCIPSGETIKIPQANSADLMEAAKGIVADIDEDAERMRNDSLDAINENIPPVTDAEYEEVGPQSEAELVAAELAEANERNADDTRVEVGVRKRPLECLWDNWEPGVEVTASEFMHHVVAVTGKCILHKTKKAKLRLIAFGNDVKAAYDKACIDLYDWYGKRIVDVRIFADKQLAAWKTFKEQLKVKHQLHDGLRRSIIAEGAPVSEGAFKLIAGEISESLKDMRQVYEQEMRRMSKRITTLEKALHANNRAVNKVANSGTENLNALLAAIAANRKAKAIELYREMTDSTLADAKAAIQGALA